MPRLRALRRARGARRRYPRVHAVSGRCDLSDLPVEQCACRVHGPKAEPVPTPHAFTARYAGECVECWEEIVPGEQIVSRSRGYVHEECAG